jgi:hypothetical protein
MLVSKSHRQWLRQLLRDQHQLDYPALEAILLCD